MPIFEPATAPEELDPERIDLIRAHLQSVLRSQAFEGSKRAQSFLRLVIERALAGRLDELRERVIGAEMFGRPIDYDTANDAVVRVKASEVRKKLAQYYRELHEEPPVRIELPSGSYVPKFHWQSAPMATQGREPHLESFLEAAPAQTSSTQQFVTFTQELPDAFTAVSAALQELRQSGLPVQPAARGSQRRATWKPIHLVGILLAAAIFALALAILLTRH